jgi:hypothetical protein
MVPNPNCVLRDPVVKEKYVLYVAFEGTIPKENEDTGDDFDYYEEKIDSESDTVEVTATIYYENYG